MTGPLRPVFQEGQVLAAADLAATVGYARAAATRHARYLHDWGIAEGLGLTTQSRTDTSGTRYVEVTLAAGLAVDGTGREIVVPAAVVLSENDFATVNGADQPTTDPYPVFLTAVDRAQTSTGPTSCAGATGPTRVEESYQIIFGRRGDEQDVGADPPPAVDAAPADPPTAWRVLLGYVHWANPHFTDAGAAGPVPPRYAGVRADTVTARSGTLALRAQTAVQEGKPALVLSAQDPPSLVFGLYKGSGGEVSPLMTVAANGNLTVAGSFAGRISAGSVLATSGTATDGMLLPLPAGVSPQEVADGRVQLHVSVTPRVPPTDSGLVSPAEATVDGDRRVRCRLRFYDPAATGAKVTEAPGAVDFLVLATVAATSGGAG